MDSRHDGNYNKGAGNQGYRIASDYWFYNHLITAALGKVQSDSLPAMQAKLSSLYHYTHDLGFAFLVVEVLRYVSHISEG